MTGGIEIKPIPKKIQKRDRMKDKYLKMRPDGG